jgi:hypothetical protein
MSPQATFFILEVKYSIKNALSKVLIEISIIFKINKEISID